MRLLSPWALVGLIAIVGPIAAHLLARRPPRTLRFPNLRFLPPTLPTPVTRHRLADRGLLILRIAIIAGAAFALSGPTGSGSSGSRVLEFSGASGSGGSSGSAGSAVPMGAASRELSLLTSASDRAGAAAAFAAAVQHGAPQRVAGDRDVALVFPGFETRESLLKKAAPVSAPWMSDLYTSVTTHPLVTAAAERLNRAPLDLLKVMGDRSQQGRLLVFVDAPAHSLFATATISAVLTSVPLRSVTSGSSSVSRVQHPEDASSMSSMARWVWLVVALLLVVETAVRRRRSAPAHIEEHARVA